MECIENGYCIIHNSWLCGHKAYTAEFKNHMEAFDKAILLLNKYNHGRCDIYHTGGKVFFICKKPVR